MANASSIQSEINQLQSQVSQFQAIFSSPTSSLSQKQQAQIDIVGLESQIVSLRSQLIIAQAEEQAGAAVVPPPPRSAGQTVNDDAIDNPAKAPSLETDPNTGRVRPVVLSTAPTNADDTPTEQNGNVDLNLNNRVVTFASSQVPSLAGNIKELPFFGGVTRPGFTANIGLPGFGKAPTTIGIGATDDAATPSANNTATAVNQADNSQVVQPQPNVLDQFGSYTYSASIYLMTPEQYKTLITSKTKTVIGYNLLIQSGGAPVSSTQPTGTPGAGRNPWFGEDFYIDSITLETNFPGKLTRGCHSASALKMSIIEPAGITFLDRLYKAVQDFVPKDGAGAINYTAVQYLLVLRWYGWDLNGKLVTNIGGGPPLSDPNAIVEKFIPFNIRKINWGVSNKLVTYDLDCAPISQTIGVSTSRGTIPYDIELSDGTIKGLLAGDPQVTATSAATTTTTSTPAPNNASSAPSSRTVIRQGLMGAMNDFQKKLVADGIYEVADEYDIVFASGAEVIGNASVTKPENVVKNLSATPMAPPVTKNPTGADPNRTNVDTTVRNYTITAGQQIIQVIDQIIRNSTFITGQARVVEQEEPEIFTDELGNEITIPRNNPPTAKILWHNVTMDSVPIKYDKKRNDYAYKTTYIVSTYVAPNFDSKYFPVPQFNGIHKSYKYWWTGENLEVLDYQVTFNSLYNQTISGTEPGNSATDRIRQQRSSSMRDIPKYVYQARSSESSQGAKGAGNEIGANAAEYLYSPGDMSTAKVRLVGDPAWIMQGSLAEGVNAKNFNYSGFLPDGTINFDSQQVLFEIAWQRPQDYDINTGLADPYATTDGAREPIQSNIYHARKCISEFKQGKFEQTIEGALYSWPIPAGQTTPATRAATTNVASSNASSPANIPSPTAPADIQPSGSGTVSAPAAPEPVNLQTAASTTVITTANDTLARQQNSAPTSNGADIGVNGLSVPQVVSTSVTADGVQTTVTKTVTNNGVVFYQTTQQIISSTP